jgi:putative inorganic carbon (HCO3(-)) transporter
VLLFYAIVNWTNSKPRLRLVILVFTLAGLIIALFAPFSVTWNTGKLVFIPKTIYERFTAFVSDTVHPNVMGGNLILLLPLPLSILIFGWKYLSWWSRIYFGLAVLVMTFVILLTKSRGTWIALTAVVILITLLRWRIGWVLIIIGTGILVVSIFLIGFTDFIEILTANDALIGIEGRIDIWSRAVFMIQDFPITGIGFGIFMDIADNLYRFFLFPAGKIIHAHNLFLQIAVDIGLPGLIAWLAIFLSFCWINWKIFRHGANQGNSLESGLGVGLLGSSLALAVHGLTDAVTWGFIRTAPMVWALWGVSLAIYFIGQQPTIFTGSTSRVNDRLLQE